MPIKREPAAEAAASSASGRVVALQTLSAGLAHELRNPLNAARLQLELLERRVERTGGDPRLLEPLALASHELERLGRLLNEFLAFARPHELALGEHDVVAIAREVIAREQPLAERRGARLGLRPSGGVVAQVDAAKLEQIVQNLIRNAIEAVSAGGRVDVGIRGDRERVYITVEDDGPGIPEPVRDRIYEPFFSTKDGGTGLGMSIVHSMVAAHGGTIELASSPRGTRFEIAVPR